MSWGEGLGLDLEGKHGLGSEQGEAVSRGQREEGAGDVMGTMSGPTRNQLLELGIEDSFLHCSFINFYYSNIFPWNAATFFLQIQDEFLEIHD